MTEDEREQQLDMDFRREIQISAIEQEIMMSRAVDRLVREHRVSTKLEAEILARVICYGWKLHSKPKVTAEHALVCGPVPLAHTGVGVAPRRKAGSLFHPRNQLRQFARKSNLGMTPETAIPHGSVPWIELKGTKATQKHQLTIGEA